MPWELQTTCGSCRRESEEFLSPSRTTVVPCWCPLSGGHTLPGLAGASTWHCPSPCMDTMHAWLGGASSMVLVHSELFFMSKLFGHGWEFLPFRLLKLGTKSLTVNPTCHGAAAPLLMTYTHTGCPPRAELPAASRMASGSCFILV